MMSRGNQALLSLGVTTPDYSTKDSLDEEVRYPNNTEFNEFLDKGTIGAERSIYGIAGCKF